MKIGPSNPLKEHQRWSKSDRAESRNYPSDNLPETTKRRKVSDIAARSIPLDKQLPRDRI